MSATTAEYLNCYLVRRIIISFGPLVLSVLRLPRAAVRRALCWPTGRARPFIDRPNASIAHIFVTEARGACVRLPCAEVHSAGFGLASHIIYQLFGASRDIKRPDGHSGIVEMKREFFLI